jgi:very-short-patch-repair endonuclease
MYLNVRPRCEAAAMKVPRKTDIRTIREILRQQGNLIMRSQALGAGMSVGALRHKVKQGGAWTVVLPGVYLAYEGQLTIGQREIAAALYAGRGCVITGRAALRRFGCRIEPSDTVEVLVPAKLKRRSSGFVQVIRTARMPDSPLLIDGLWWASAARAVADAARRPTELREVRAIVADAVQRGKCTTAEIAKELREGPKQGSGALRAALAEVADGIRSVAEGDLRALIKHFGLPDPMYNPQLFVGGAFLAEPDAWWPDAGVAAEMDSRTYHLSPGAWEKDLARDAAMTAQGILVVHVTPTRIRSEPAAVARLLWSTYKKGRQRPPLEIRAVPHDETFRRPAGRPSRTASLTR